MQYETQNQNTNTQVAQEEAPAQTEAPQNQDIGAQDHSTFEAAVEPSVPSTEGQETVDQVLPLDMDSEPSNFDPAVTMTSENLGIGMEDTSADPSASDLFGNDDFLSTVPVNGDVLPDDIDDSVMNLQEVVELEDSTDWLPYSLDGSDTPDPAATTGIIMDPIPTDQAQPLDSEVAEPLSPEAVSMPIDKIVKPVPTDQGEELAGDSGEEGYDPDPDVYGPGITPDESYEILKDWSDESDDSNYGPDDEHVPDYDPEEDYGPNYNPYFEFGPADEHDPDVEGDHDPSVVGEEDAREAGSDPAEVDYQAVLDDLADGNLDKVRDFIQNLARGDEETRDAPGDHEPGNFVNEGISLGDIVGENDVEMGLDEAGTNPDDMSEEDYTYDEAAYEDAEDAFEDLQDALQDGDEEDLAEALEELKSYIGGFDKGDEEDQEPSGPEVDGSTPNDEQEPASPEQSEEPPDSRPKSSEEHDHHGDQEDEQDENEIRDEAGSDPAEVDYQAVLDDLADGNLDKVRDFIQNLARSEEEAQATTGDSEHDPQDPYGGLDTDDDGILDYMDSDSPNQTGEWISGFNGMVWVPFNKEGDDSPENPEAPDASGAAVSGPAVGAGAVVSAGAAGEALGDLTNGDFDETLDTVAEQAGGAVDDALGIEGSGEILDDVVNGDFDEALDAAAGIADGYASSWVEGLTGSEALGEAAGEAINDLANGDFSGALDAVGEGIDEAYDSVVETASEYASDWVGDLTGSEALGEAAGDVVEDVGEAVEDFFDGAADTISGWFD
jgi:hypothetical protein